MSDCVFCKVIVGELPAKFAYSDEEVVAIHDIAPKAPVHILVMPKKHLTSLSDVSVGDQVLLGRLLYVVKEIASKFQIHEKGYKVIINNGKAAGQLVDHIHVHVLGGWGQPEKWRV